MASHPDIVFMLNYRVFITQSILTFKLLLKYSTWVKYLDIFLPVYSDVLLFDSAIHADSPQILSMVFLWIVRPKNTQRPVSEHTWDSA